MGSILFEVVTGHLLQCLRSILPSDSGRLTTSAGMAFMFASFVSVGRTLEEINFAAERRQLTRRLCKPACRNCRWPARRSTLIRSSPSINPKSIWNRVPSQDLRHYCIGATECLAHITDPEQSPPLSRMPNSPSLLTSAYSS